MRNNRILFLILGLFFFAIGGLLLVTNLVADEPFHTSFLLMFALTVMCFCLSYLSPHFQQKDERMKLIREKGMFFSVSALMVYLIIFNLGLQIEFFTLAANELLHILTALIICTVFISFVVYSRIY
ncbi:permease [Robertmurraya siralis]|uniref:permease n=1 Tax=Robertmurraya siralis TaxID=77777 RepID=UPI0010F9675E|nr:permease [Robertmurraya siralis]